MILCWTRPNAAGFEHAVVVEEAARVVVRGIVAASEFGWSYRLETDRDWRTREVEVEASDGGRLALCADGSGAWRDGTGMALEALRGCLDVDLEATPLTNTLPIRRLGLAVGAVAEIASVHVSAPELGVRHAAQRYVRTAERRYGYEGLETGAHAEIEVDAAGFVTLYPGVFERSEDP